MNREEAMAWLVENVTKWPYSVFYRPSGSGWYWYLTKDGDSVFKSDRLDDEITQTDWLAAKQAIDTTTSPRNN